MKRHIFNPTHITTDKGETKQQVFLDENGLVSWERSKKLECFLVTNKIQ